MFRDFYFFFFFYVKKSGVFFIPSAVLLAKPNIPETGFKINPPTPLPIPLTNPKAPYFYTPSIGL